MEQLLPLNQSVCEKPPELGGEALVEGIFSPGNGVWWRHTEVVQNQVISPIDVANLWGYTDPGCGF